VTCLPDDRRPLLEPEHPELSVRRQCRLLGINRSSFYYGPAPAKIDDRRLSLMRLVDEIYTKHPFFWNKADEQLSPTEWAS